MQEFCGANRHIRDEFYKTPFQLAKSEAMRELFRKSTDWLRRGMEEPLDRIEILLSRTNPLEEAIVNSDLTEAVLLINHPQFTTPHLEEGFKFAFTEEVVRNDDFLFNLFAGQATLNDLTNRILPGKLIRLNNVERELTNIVRFIGLLSQPDTRTADDFDLGRGDTADRVMENMRFNDFLQYSESRERTRLAELNEKTDRKRYLTTIENDLQHQIAILNRLQNHFNHLTGLKTSTQN